MSIPINTHANFVRLLLTVKDENGIYRILSRKAGDNGINITLKPLIPPIPQVMDFLEFEWGLPAKDIEIIDIFVEELLEGDNSYLLLLAKIRAHPASGSVASETFPEFLRRLPKERLRLPFLKAWQILMGSHLEVQKALTLKDFSS